jgi:uncharacterized DUF497 family protein
MLSYDEAKRRQNIARHGIDFSECDAIFDAPMLTEEDDRAAYGECRYRSLGLLVGRVVVLVWTERDDATRLISCRYGDKNEIFRYFKAFF